MAKKLVIAMVPVAALTIAVVAGILAVRAVGDRRSEMAARDETAADAKATPALPALPAFRPRPPEPTVPRPAVTPVEGTVKAEAGRSAGAPAQAADAAAAAAAAAAKGDPLMDKLRALAGKDPEQILRLARAANARDPDGPHAPERAWMVVKSLTDLGRLSEAKDEAQTMVNRYPGTSWAMDVQRHLLSNPL